MAMVTDEVALTLHDRSTRGATLSSEEQAQLDQWYAAQDNAEQVILRSATASSAAQDLQSHVTAVLERCIALAQHIQELSNHNDVLRREVAQLRQQVAHLLHPA